MMRAVRIAVALGTLYALTLVSTDPEDLAIGVAVGLLLVTGLGTRLRLEPKGAMPPLVQRALWFPPFAAAILVDVVRGTWDVAIRVVHLRPLVRPGIVRVPIGERSERGVAVAALVTTLSPGTVLVDVDWSRGDLLVHAIDASEPDALRAGMQRFYDRYQRRVFP